MTEEAKDLQVRDETLPAEIASILQEGAGEGQDFARDELARPFFTILQDLSPQVKKANSQFIEGAEPGDLFLTSPPTVLESAHLVFLAHAQVIQGWRDRKAGGGFIGAWAPGKEPSETIKMEGEWFVRLKDDPQITLIDTIQYIAMVCDEEAKPLGPAQISFKSTGLKYARKLNASITSRKISAPDGSKVPAPIWGLIFPVSTLIEEGNNNTWFNWKIGEAATITDVDLLVACRDAAHEVDRSVFYQETRDGGGE